MNLISFRTVTKQESNFIHIAGLTPHVKKVAKIVKLYDEYVSKLGSIEQKIQQEKAQFESEKFEFQVPQSLVGLIIGKQGINKRAIQDKHGVKIFVEDGEVNATIHLSGKDILVLEQIRQEMELFERLYEVPDSKVSYFVGPKYQNLTTFKEKAGLMVLMLLRKEESKTKTHHVVRVVGNTEALETFDIIFETHIQLFDQQQKLARQQ